MNLKLNQLHQTRWASPQEIEFVQAEVARKLGIQDVYLEMTWKFNKKFVSTYGQAEYGTVGDLQLWTIQYASKYWLKLRDADRKNLITHEMCHLAVERLCGHGKIVDNKRVTGHGYHWRKYMDRCGEDPDGDASYQATVNKILPTAAEIELFDLRIKWLKASYDAMTTKITL